jgi:glycosyltransferase involved in cell wall biosynthesis
MEPSVSIIIPVYNYGRYVDQAVASAINQTYSNREVILIDDGSTDFTYGTLKMYERYKGTRVFSQRNMGVSVARNRGALVSRGEFLLFLDADDWIEPNYLERTVPLMADSAVGVVSTDYVNFGATDGGVVAKPVTLGEEMAGNSIPITSLIRRTAFTQTPGYTTAFINATNNRQQLAFEDWNLWIDILKRGWKVAVVNEPLFHYRTKAAWDRNWRNSPETLDASGDVGEWCKRIIRSLHPELDWRV